LGGTTEGALAVTVSAPPPLGAARSGANTARLQLRGAAAAGRSAVAAAVASGEGGASSESAAAADPPSYAAFYPLFEQRFEQWAREHPTEEPRRCDFADCLPHHRVEWPARFDFAALGFSERLDKRKRSFAANVFMCFCMTAAVTTMSAEQFAALEGTGNTRKFAFRTPDGQCCSARLDNIRTGNTRLMPHTRFAQAMDNEQQLQKHLRMQAEALAIINAWPAHSNFPMQEIAHLVPSARRGVTPYEWLGLSKNDERKRSYAHVVYMFACRSSAVLFMDRDGFEALPVGDRGYNMRTPWFCNSDGRRIEAAIFSVASGHSQGLNETERHDAYVAAGPARRERYPLGIAHGHIAERKHALMFINALQQHDPALVTFHKPTHECRKFDAGMQLGGDPKLFALQYKTGEINSSGRAHFGAVSAKYVRDGGLLVLIAVRDGALHSVWVLWTLEQMQLLMNCEENPKKKVSVCVNGAPKRTKLQADLEVLRFDASNMEGIAGALCAAAAQARDFGTMEFLNDDMSMLQNDNLKLEQKAVNALKANLGDGYQLGPPYSKVDCHIYGVATQLKVLNTEGRVTVRQQRKHGIPPNEVHCMLFQHRDDLSKVRLTPTRTRDGTPTIPAHGCMFNPNRCLDSTGWIDTTTAEGRAQLEAMLRDFKQRPLCTDAVLAAYNAEQERKIVQEREEKNDRKQQASIDGRLTPAELYASLEGADAGNSA
jgi:hypothetical protein